jgi:hypothetical protein
MGNRFQAGVAGFVLMAGQDRACGFDGDCRRDPHNSTGPNRQPPLNINDKKCHPSIRSEMSPIYPVPTPCLPSPACGGRVREGPLDAAPIAPKGIEEQTRKLFEVSRLRECGASTRSRSYN